MHRLLWPWKEMAMGNTGKPCWELWLHGWQSTWSSNVRRSRKAEALPLPCLSQRWSLRCSCILQRGWRCGLRDTAPQQEGFRKSCFLSFSCYPAAGAPSSGSACQERLADSRGIPGCQKPQPQPPRIPSCHLLTPGFGTGVSLPIPGSFSPLYPSSHQELSAMSLPLSSCLCTAPVLKPLRCRYRGLWILPQSSCVIIHSDNTLSHRWNMLSSSNPNHVISLLSSSFKAPTLTFPFLLRVWLCHPPETRLNGKAASSTPCQTANALPCDSCVNAHSHGIIRIMNNYLCNKYIQTCPYLNSY